MAYGIFTSRKISLTNQIFQLQSKLDNIMQQKQKMLNFSANIADGRVTVEEMASDPTNLGNYSDFVTSYNAWKATSDDEGGCATSTGAIMDQAVDQNQGDAYLLSINEILETSVSQEYAQAYQKKLDALENQLDMQQKKIETQLSASEKQLEQVEQAEAKAIDRATPKYDGVG